MDTRLNRMITHNVLISHALLIRSCSRTFCSACIHIVWCACIEQPHESLIQCLLCFSALYFCSCNNVTLVAAVGYGIGNPTFGAT